MDDSKFTWIPLFFKSTISIIFIFVSGCTQILHKEFQDEAGPWPSGALPGAPAGDSVTVNGSVEGQGSCIILGSQEASSVDFITGGHPHNTNGYAIRFTGLRTTITDPPVIAIDALDAGGLNACGLEISGGEFRLVSGNGENVIGEYTASADAHRVLLRLNNLNSTNSSSCGIRIVQVSQQPGGEVPPPIDALAPLINQQFQELDRLRVRWENGDGAAPTNYFLCEEVTINKDG